MERAYVVIGQPKASKDLEKLAQLLLLLRLLEDTELADVCRRDLLDHLYLTYKSLRYRARQVSLKDLQSLVDNPRVTLSRFFLGGVH